MDTVYVYLSCFSHVVRLVDIHVCADLPFHDRVRVRVGVRSSVFVKHISMFDGHRSGEKGWIRSYMGLLGLLACAQWACGRLVIHGDRKRFLIDLTSESKSWDTTQHQQQCHLLLRIT